MEWLTQNWIWLVVIAGAVWMFSRGRHGGLMGGCCGTHDMAREGPAGEGKVQAVDTSPPSIKEETAVQLPVFVLVWLARGGYKTRGFAFLTYLAGYGAARFSVEFFRGNSAIFARGIPAAQVFGVTLILAAVAGFGVLGQARSKTG